MPESFSAEAIATIARAQEAGDALLCPSCAVALDERRVHPRHDVSYVRRRLWLVCPRCHRTVVLDTPPNR